MSERYSSRGEELLVQRAIFGLDAEENAELRSLIAEGEVDDDPSLELAAGAVAVLFAEDEGPLPEHLHRTLSEQADRFVSGRSRRLTGGDAPPAPGLRRSARPTASPTPAEPPRPAEDPDIVARVGGPRSGSSAWLPWAAAAAIGVVAIAGWFRPAVTPEQPRFGATLAEAREALIQRGVQPVEWTPWAMGPDAPPELEGVEGDVVWDDQTQTGFMRFVGLPINDPTELQYQLWIIDARYGDDAINQRVSGGVFNSAARYGKVGEIIIPIEPALPIGEAAHFAVTIERPGGVWVSDMSRRVVIAPPLGE